MVGYRMEVPYLAPTFAASGEEHSVNWDGPSPTRVQLEVDGVRARRGTVLCLSGGGFRACLFHLGAMRFMYEKGLLCRLDAIASVSGGSILAALVGLKWDLLRVAEPDMHVWEREIGAPIRSFAFGDQRSWPFWRGMLGRPQAVERLAERYSLRLYGDAELSDLSPSLRLMICATNLTTGALWRFERDQLGDEVLGYQHPPSAITSVATAVAVSSCFPPLFRPLQLKLDSAQFVPSRLRDDTERSKLAKRTLLNDGGAYDNLAVEGVWPAFERVLVSDAGAGLGMYRPRGVQRVSLHAMRTAEVNDAIGRESRRRWLKTAIETGAIEGAYWGISGAPVEVDTSFAWGYSPAFVTSRIATVRTDLACFEADEQRVLENHGYAMAFAATHSWAFEFFGLSPTPKAPQLPHVESCDEDRLSSAMRHSHWRSKIVRDLLALT